METLEIIRNVNRLPLSQQMLIAQRIIHSIRKREQPSLETAAERLYADYVTDENLTVFTKLDCEDFYEAKNRKYHVSRDFSNTGRNYQSYRI